MQNENNEKQYCIFYIVRHGETVASFRLSFNRRRSKTSAIIRAKNFNTIQFDPAFSSDLLRAKRTAEIIALERKLIVTTRKLLRERTFGGFEGDILGKTVLVVSHGGMMRSLLIHLGFGTYQTRVRWNRLFHQRN